MRQNGISFSFKILGENEQILRKYTKYKFKNSLPDIELSKLIPQDGPALPNTSPMYAYEFVLPFSPVDN